MVRYCVYVLDCLGILNYFIVIYRNIIIIIIIIRRIMEKINRFKGYELCVVVWSVMSCLGEHSNYTI